jgi:hypothetical protein
LEAYLTSLAWQVTALRAYSRTFQDIRENQKKGTQSPKTKKKCEGFKSKEISKTGLNEPPFPSNNQTTPWYIMGTCQSNSLLLERTRINHPTLEMRFSRFPPLYTLNRVPV